MAEKRGRVAFVEPMLLLRTEKLPEGHDWLYELKFDGYRALAIKRGGPGALSSPNANPLTRRAPSTAAPGAGMPADDVISDVGHASPPSRNPLHTLPTA